MAGNGWIKLYRRIQNHWLWKNDKPFDKRSAWLDILMLVNHEPGKVYFNNEIVEVDRGEHITSEVKLADRWGWSRTKVRNFLSLLEQDNMIENIKENKKRTRLRVLNYGDYQRPANNKKTGGKQEENNRKTGGEHKQECKEVKNVKNEKKLNNKCSDSKESNDDSKSTEKDEPKFSENDPAYKAAIYLKKKIMENNDKTPVPNSTPEDMENWVIELDRLNRLGPVGAKNKGYTWNEIKEIIDWCQDNSFWKSNILSAGKLREKVVTLENQMKRDKEQNSNDLDKSIDLVKRLERKEATQK